MPGTVLSAVSTCAGNLLHLGEVLADHLDAHRRADAGRQHVDARLDRHRPGVGDAGELQRPVHLLDEAVDGHARAPFLLRLEVDDGLEHLDRRRVGGGLRPARLAVDRRHLRERADDAVLRLQQLGRLGDRQPRQGGRHVEQRALVEVGHELACRRASPATPIRARMTSASAMVSVLAFSTPRMTGR